MENAPTTQVEELLRKYENLSDKDLSDSDGPKVAVPSSYVLTQDQEAKLLDHAEDHIKSMERELGRDTVMSKDWSEKPDSYRDREDGQRRSRMHLPKRELFEAVYYNKVRWRQFLEGTIFATSNLVVPVTRRIARQMVARMNKFIFGSDPWFDVFPSPGSKPGNDDLAKVLKAFARTKLKESGSAADKKMGTELSMVHGEVVYKTVYSRIYDYFKRLTPVLVDPNTGEPLLDAAGGFIFEEDEWVPGAMVDGETGDVLVDGETGEELVDEGNLVLERDGQTPKPEVMIWQNVPVDRRVKRFAGVKSEPIYFKDFLCPLTAPSVQEAAGVAHLYSMPIMDLADMILPNENEENPGRKRMEHLIAIIRNLAGAGSKDSGMDEQDAAADQQRESLEEDSDPFDGSSDPAKDPELQIAEWWGRFDANGDGVVEEVCLVYERTQRIPIFYEYTANLTQDGSRPFDVQRIIPILGRWYGMGVVEMFEESQQVIDLFMNRWSARSGEAGRIDLFRAYLTLEGQDDPNLKLNWGETYTPADPNVKPEDILQSVYLENHQHHAIKDIFQFFLQIMMNESGVSSANDAQMAGLDTGDLATGIRHMEESGQELFDYYLDHCRSSLEGVLRREIMVLLDNMDQMEVFEYSEDGKTAEVLQLTEEDIRGIDLKVFLLLSEKMSREAQAKMQEARGLVVEFYTAIPPGQAQEAAAPVYRALLKSYDLRNFDPDAAIQPLQMPEGGAA